MVQSAGEGLLRFTTLLSEAWDWLAVCPTLPFGRLSNVGRRKQKIIHAPTRGINRRETNFFPLRCSLATQALPARCLARPVRTLDRIQPCCEHRTLLDRKRHPRTGR